MKVYFFLTLLIFCSAALADDRNHKYSHGEEVILWVNKVGPYHNPQETYDFYSLPFCRPTMKEIRHKKNSLGVILEGDQLTDSGLSIRFKRM
jgi:transmembrane 9 superfamily member 3